MVNIVSFTDDINIEPTVAILIKENAVGDLTPIKRNYIDGLNIDQEKVVVAKLPYFKKFKVSEAKLHLQKLIPALARLGVEYLYIADSNYAKILLDERSNIKNFVGIGIKRPYTGYNFMMMYGVNYRQAFYNDAAVELLQFTLDQLNKFMQDAMHHIKQNPLTDYQHVSTIPEMFTHFEQLSNVNVLTCDIETFGLDFSTCGIATISFGANKHTAISMRIDVESNLEPNNPIKTDYVPNIPKRHALRNFIENYKGTFIWHNANFDAKVLIYYLWMEEDLLNYEGLLKGLEIMTRKFHDTKLIAYLALNSTARSDLSLKTLAMEHMGQYAIDVTDISQHEIVDILKYNANDAIATRFVYDKFYPRMVKDDQLHTYAELFIPSVKVLLQMELTGMPMEKKQVMKVSRSLTRKLHKYLDFVALHPIVELVEQSIRETMAEKANKKLKKLRKTAEDFSNECFNPNSGPQLALLVYEIMGYSVTKYTDAGAPSTKTSVLKSICSQAKPEHKTVLRALIAIKEISIIVNTFIGAFIDKSVEKDDGRIYLHGSFNLGGTVSGRLSSSKPNMQNIPSTGSIYAKLIKSCFVAPDGWIMVGADFSSLEDRISALITKDPNKLKVYEDGYDGHCLRAYYYFSSDMPDIDPNSVQSINSIATLYPKQRQDSKGPTFCLTYGGTRYALVDTCGLNHETAIQIEENYHKMYEVSDQWVEDRIQQASRDGYVTVAFGLRVRTPYLKRCVLGSSSTPPEASAEARTAGNALGQSYGLLNNRAAIEFQQRCLASPYKLDIKPIAHIHDSQYFIIRDSVNVLEWFNKNLIECMEWQQLPELVHPNVRLGGEVEVYYPSWAKNVVLPNNADKETIRTLCQTLSKNSSVSIG